MTRELVPAVICFAIAGLFVVAGLKRGQWFNDFRFCQAGTLTFVVLGTLMLIPMDDIVGETGKWVLLIVAIGLLLLTPIFRNLYLHWQNWAEIEAQELASNGRYHAAIAVLEYARAQGKPSLLRLNLLVFCLHAIGRYEEALEIVEEAERQFGLSQELTIKKAFCLARLGESEAALSLFAPMLDQLPNDFDLIFQHASLLLQMGMRDEAQRQYDRVEVLFLREPSDERKQEWRPKLDKMRAVLRGGVNGMRLHE